ncbi:MAG: hypothetical protein VX829_05500 [Pseudomonadota bacterium]|uniref:hypothetical protein n=1 Tax=Methylophaga aminisulfidivorans TaxID=230105 RepID=UPI0024E255E9|nr:hypothetical protein [Methylophaga aminisulfidivorans]MEC9412117.1 hypothetical protein [Pseudomonadota bacterium]
MTILNSQLSPQFSDTEECFDVYGRCLPGSIRAQAHKKTRRYFILDTPEIDLQQIYNRHQSVFDIEKVLAFSAFENKVNAIKASIAKHSSMENILNGPGIPFILPQLHQNDIGQQLEQRFLPAIAQLFADYLPDSDFTNHVEESLVAKLTPAASGRQQYLLNKVRESAVVGMYFPCFLGFSVEAARQQIELFPENFLLSGAYDTTAAFISVPELLFRKDGYPPLLWLAGMETDNPKANYHFEAYGYNLTFNKRPHFNQAAEYWASGITVLE